MITNLSCRLGGALIRRANPSFWRFKRFLAKRKVFDTSPYSLETYIRLLDFISESDVDRLCDFDKNYKVGRERNWYVRHDIDERGCLSRAAEMIRIDMNFGVRPGVFFRVESDAYQLAAAKPLVDEFMPSGIVFGLHSECYLSDDWFARLEREVEIYKQTFGMPPFAINAHGYGDFRISVRQKFYQGLTPNLMSRLGIELNDCGSEFRQYKHVIQDCHNQFNAEPNNLSTGLKNRCILTDFIELPPSGWVTNGLILTHPCYWNSAGH